MRTMGEEPAPEFCGAYPRVKLTTSFAEVLKDDEVKGVMIATPASSHALAKPEFLSPPRKGAENDVCQ